MFTALGASGAVLTGLLVACKGGGNGNHATAFAYDAQADGAFDDGGPDGPTVASFVRFANWAPDGVGGLDMCVTSDSDLDGGMVTWLGPLIGTGVTVPKITSYVAIAPGSTAVSVVVAGKGCGSRVAPPAQLPPLDVGSYATVALVGDIDPFGSDKPAQVVTFADDAVGPQGQAAVRFIDALPGGSAVVFGTGTLAAGNFSPVTATVPVGGASFMPANGIMADANGYLLLSPQSGITVAANNPSSQNNPLNGLGASPFDAGLVNPAGTTFGTGDDLATGSHAVWPPGGAVTVALIDGNFGITQELVLCLDGALGQESMAACTLLSP